MTPPAGKKKLSEAERKQVADQIAELQASLEDEAEAEGAEASAEATAEVEEQREQLATLFDRLQISEEDWELMSAAFSTGTEERTRSIVREVLAEEEEAEGDGSLKEAAEKPGGEAPPVPVPDAPPENAPPSKHWTERRILGGKKDEE